MKQYFLAFVFIFTLFQLYADGILENFETGIQDSFNGSSALTWVGDVGDFEITTAGWPVSPAPDFIENNSIRAQENQDLNSTILTKISDVYSPDLKMRWEIFVSGKSTTVTSTRGFSLILFVDSNDTDNIEKGNVNGYRIHVYDPVGFQDGLFFEKANGSGWQIIDYIETAEAIKLNQGWNIVVERDQLGNWSWGYSNGDYGTAILLTESTIDNDFTSGAYSGVYWYSIASYSSSFGFDNFQLDPYMPGLWKANAESSNWTTASNWDDGLVPSASSTIQIEAGTNQPLIESDISCGGLTLEPEAKLSINNGFTLSVNGNFTLQSDINGTASMIDNGSLSIVGRSIIQRYLECYDPDATNEYHFLSIPVTDHAVENSLSHYYVYPYDETKNAWTALSLGDQVLKGRGYSVYYSGDASQRVEFLGTPNTGDQIISISASNYSGNPSNDNWNLIGNPFPSSIDWDEVSKNNIESAVYIWNPQTCTYASYVDGVGANFNDDGIIPAMQGFFVHASSSGNLTIPQAARCNDLLQDYLVKNGTNHANLKIRLKNQKYSDECVLRFKNNATELWDKEFDALKILSSKQEVPQICTLINGDIRASINSLPDKLSAYEIPLLSKVWDDGVYDLCFNGISSLLQDYKIVLKDKINGENYEIKKDSCLQLYLIAGEPEQIILHLDRQLTAVQDEKIVDIGVNVAPGGYVEVSNISTEFMGGELKIVALDGKKIYSTEINNQNIQFSIYCRGVFVLQLKSTENIFTQKIIIL